MQKSGGVNPAPILGAAPTPINAVTPTLDYEGHPSDSSPRPPAVPMPTFDADGSSIAELTYA